MWEGAIGAALALFLSGIPRVIAFLAILIIGWLIASALAGVVAAILRAVNFNDLARRSGISGFIQNMGVNTDASGLLATIAKWFVRLIVLVVAFDALGLPAVSQVLQQFLLWIPNLIVAMVVLVIAGLLATAARNLVRSATAEAGFGNPNVMATLAQVAVWGFGIIIAVNQIGVADTLVNTLFMGLVGALALAIGLSFGLGGRDTAARIVEGWYLQAQQAGPKLARAADAAERQAQFQSAQVTRSMPPADRVHVAEEASYSETGAYPEPPLRTSFRSNDLPRS